MSSEQTPTITEIAEIIRIAWIIRPTYRSDWMTLRDLRDRLDSYEDVTITREQVDQALAHMLGAHQVRLIPESNQKTLTQADRDAAIWLGGEYHHLISFIGL